MQLPPVQRRAWHGSIPCAGMKNWAVVAPKVPLAAHPVLEKIVHAYQGHIRLSAPRQSKWGDFRWAHGEATRISVNRDLGPEAFLITLLHELAHAQVHAWDPGEPLPHGPEWQARYRNLLRPFLDQNVFSAPVAVALRQSLGKPKASCGADSALMKALHLDRPALGSTVGSLALGVIFRTAGGQIFRKGPKRRTRFECKEVSSGRTFAVHPLMEVTPLPSA